MKHLNRKLRALSLIGLSLLVFVVSLALNVAFADTVQNTDFQKQSFSKVTDWFDYVRQYATANGFPPPNASEHAYIYTNFINVNGFQLFYVGLVNATHNGRYVTIPLQTFFEHYKTPRGKTAITASSFISLVAFKDNTTAGYQNSPDVNDELYASFSLGVDLQTFTGRPMPPLVGSSQTIPLTASSDSLHWSWGLKYTNLNAIWWRMFVDPLYPRYNGSYPRGLAQYAELTFNYDLTIDPSTKTAKLVTSYTIGKVTDLWLLSQIPQLHLNSTGTYYLNGTQALTQTVYDFLQQGQYKMSIVLAHKAIIASHNASDKDDSGTTVDDSDADVSRTGINTSAEDGERVFRADFGVKPTYKLYDTSDTTSTTYNATTRTVRRPGWGGNPVFAFQNRFMGLLPLFVAHVDPALIKQAKDGMVSFAAADYLYIVSYPQWGGTRIVHDPDYTAFYQPSSNAGVVTALFIVVAIAAGVGGIVAYLFRKRKTANVAITGTAGPTPPSQGPLPPGPPAPGR